MATLPSNGLESPCFAPPLVAVTPRSNAAMKLRKLIRENKCGRETGHDSVA